GGGLNIPNVTGCDPIDPSVCMQPFPNDFFTKADAGSDTGRLIDFQLQAMPRNAANKPITNTDYNLNDGFSPGQMISTRVPGLDTPQAFQQTGSAPITDIGQSVAAGATQPGGEPVLVLDAQTGAPHPIWTEIDANPTDPTKVNLLIRPAKNFTEGRRYIVVLRDMKKADGSTIPASDGFKALRDNVATMNAAIETRRQHYEDNVFTPITTAGIARADLYLAWDFTVASERNLSERALHMRNDAFTALGDSNLADRQVAGNAPIFTVSSIEDFTVAQDSRIARQVEGTITVPCYLTGGALCQPGSRFVMGADNKPVRTVPTNWSANYVCRIPQAAVQRTAGLPTGVNPARGSLYGHGLLGGAGEVEAGNVSAMAQENNMVFCATDWIGMSTFDVPNVATILTDLSNFPSLVDRAQQGFLDFMFLERLMIHPQGFNSNPAFQFGVAGNGVFDLSRGAATRAFYDGNSQGGIMGGSLAALSPDHDRAALGVPGMNYSTLLRRSVDFDTYSIGLYASYPDELQRPLILSLMQMLWDRGEANGYAQHMTDDPLAGTPPHKILLHPAFGDHQVAHVTAEVEARTIGARIIRKPALDAGHNPDVEPYWGIDAIDGGPGFPFDGSALAVWDSGTPAPPAGNLPPRTEDGYGRDPHSDPRGDKKARDMKGAFLDYDGRIIDTCLGGPCYARNHGPGSPHPAP
ncbi:MAG: hypothetical protein H0V29_10450, partial [Thermoleophilaceae bacterium]|nr:hypothetical protein [Thermoleophilaceae bacterium]